MLSRKRLAQCRDFGIELLVECSHPLGAKVSQSSWLVFPFVQFRPPDSHRSTWNFHSGSPSKT
jgi:hypothetical protein